MPCESSKPNGWCGLRAASGFRIVASARRIERATRGLVDGDLGGGIIKQRVPRPGQGRSGGYRMLVAYRAGARAVFLYAFGKNESENIDPDELLTLREIGAGWLAADAHQIARPLDEGILREVIYGDETEAP
jgi:hypothetical protein